MDPALKHSSPYPMCQSSAEASKVSLTAVVNSHFEEENFDHQYHNMSNKEAERFPKAVTKWKNGCLVLERGFGDVEVALLTRALVLLPNFRNVTVIDGHKYGSAKVLLSSRLRHVNEIWEPILGRTC
jgi:hypothetical protein